MQRSKGRSRLLHNNDALDVEPDTVDQEHIIVGNEATPCCQGDGWKAVSWSHSFAQDDARPEFGSLVIGQVFGGYGISSYI